MQIPKNRWWIAAVIALSLTGAGLLIAARTKLKEDHQKFLCWDVPSSGPPAKYQVSFDGGAPVDTTGECVRVPAGLSRGQHVAVVRAVDTYGQMSPPASLAFTVRPGR